MTIGELIQRKERPKPKPVSSDLLNGPDRLCECGSPGCGCPIITPKSQLQT